MGKMIFLLAAVSLFHLSNGKKELDFVQTSIQLASVHMVSEFGVAINFAFTVTVIGVSSS